MSEGTNRRPVVRLVGFSLSGLLMGTGLIFAGWWPVGVVGVAWYLHLLFSDPQLSYWSGFGLGWWAWTIKALLSTIWFWSAFPVDWIGDLGPGLQLVAIAFYWATAAVVMGIPGGLLNLLFLYVRKSRPTVSRIMLPVVWVGAEVLGSFLFSIWSAGDNIPLNIDYGFGYVGFLLADSDHLVMFARWGGVYGLSFLLILASVVFWRTQALFAQRLVWALVLSIAMLIWLAPVLIAPLPTLGLTVGVINTDFTAVETRSPAGRQLMGRETESAILAAQVEDLDYLLLPEDNRFTNHFSSPGETLAWYRLAAGGRAVLVDTGYTAVDGNMHQRAHIYEPDKNSVTKLDKQSLAPQGEYFPTIHGWLLSLFGQKAVVEAIKAKLRYSPGPVTALPADSSLPGVLFCYESMSPLGVRRQFANRSPALILHPTSHTWFHEPHIFWHELDTMLRTQAVWNRVPIVSSGNLARGKVYYPNGVVELVPITIASDRWEVGVIDL